MTLSGLVQLVRPNRLAALVLAVRMVTPAQSVQAQDDKELADVLRAEAPLVGAADAAGVGFFEQRIRPVLVGRCYQCHAQESKKLEGGLRLDDRQASRAGGDSGPAVVPGNVNESLLWQAIDYEGALYDMPPDGKLPANVIADFRRWIEMGAPDPREPVGTTGAPENSGAGGPPSRADLWVLQPLTRPQPPGAAGVGWARDDLDRYVAAGLADAGLTPAPPADRYTLLRRVTFDLTGLPPAPAEIESFVSDSAPSAYERVVDRLLASPAFGEHWARHWFDLSCYADLADVQGNVVVHGAWRYRDYVIEALNDDKPFDQFVREQIAGDLLPYESVEQQRQQIIATGYLSIGPWALQNYVKPQLQADVIDHQIDKISRTFLGMSVRRARCHDHKFDPIPTRDYYALAGIFHSTLTTRFDGPGVWSQIVARELPGIPDDRAAADFEQELAEARRQEAELESQRCALRSELAAALPTATSADPRLREIEQQLPAVKERLKLLEYSRRDVTHALAVQDVDHPQDASISIRGNFRTAGEVVPRGFLSAIAGGQDNPIPPETSGRRELAQWLTGPQNPVTPRVLANRVWYHVFGAGLVRSLDYFGIHGDLPSHPELLDYLATQFRDVHHWSLKSLIRQMVLSSTYRMASAPNAAAATIDPDNRLLWRMNRRRLTAESIYDSMLAVSGRLDGGRGGSSLGLAIAGNVGGIGDKVNPPTYTRSQIPENIARRRAIYQPLFRRSPDGPLELLGVFDFPHPSEITGARAERTVVTQALFLLNAPFVKEAARHMAERLLAERGGASGRNEQERDEECVQQMYLLMFNRPAGSEETRQAVEFVNQYQRATDVSVEASSELRLAAWSELCHAMFASNEFLFRE